VVGGKKGSGDDIPTVPYMDEPDNEPDFEPRFGGMPPPGPSTNIATLAPGVFHLIGTSGFGAARGGTIPWENAGVNTGKKITYFVQAILM